MPTMSLRINEEEKMIIKYAKLNNISVSELVRISVMKKIENDIDLKLYYQAIKEHIDSPSDISFEDMGKELGLDV